MAQKDTRIDCTMIETKKETIRKTSSTRIRDVFEENESRLSFDDSNMLTAIAKRRTLFCLGAAQAIDHADAAIFPAVMKALEEDLNISPSTLGSLAIGQSMCGAISAPVWGILTDNGNRIRLLTTAMLMWAAATFVLALSSNYWTIFIMRAANGVALTSLNPLTSSLTSDLFPSASRGAAFGTLMAVASVGHMLGSTFSVSISRVTFLDKIRGWRIAFLTISFFSVFGAWLIDRFALDPPRGGCEGKIVVASRFDVEGPLRKRSAHIRNRTTSEFQKCVRVAREIFSTRTFLVIVFQGIWGSIPWSAFRFITMWLQYNGLSDRTAALVSGAFTIGHMIGAFVGGRIGDWAARLSPNHGRIFVAQFSDFFRLPLILCLFRVLPAYEMGPAWYASILFLTGLLAPWVSIAANQPILSELVDPNMRGQIFAYQRLVEKVFASILGAPLVGYLSENVYGYVKRDAAQSAARIVENEMIVDRVNANALSKSMETITLVCWGTCFFLYGFVHLTYPGDRVRRNKASTSTRQC